MPLPVVVPEDGLGLTTFQFIEAKRLDGFYRAVANTLLNPDPQRPTNSLVEVVSTSNAPNAIKLDLLSWKHLLRAPTTTVSDQRERIRFIFNFFLDVGKKNGFGDNAPALTSLEKAILVLGEEGDFSGNSRRNWEERISQRSVTEIEQILDQFPHAYQKKEGVGTLLPGGNQQGHVAAHLQSRFSSKDIYDTIPLFNIWDSISFIYTTCVEKIESQLHAELHLFQFRLIIHGLRSCDYFPLFAGPTTVAAAWTAAPQFVIAFATTCVGSRRRGDSIKAAMADARSRFISIVSTRLNEPITIGEINCLNRLGNCPEFVTWRFVCREPGKYLSLCFSLDEDDGKAKALKFCNYCHELAKILGRNRFEIADLWETALLCDESFSAVRHPQALYPFRRLKSLEEVTKQSSKRSFSEIISIHGMF